jgi:hypothetical protein
MIIPAIKPLSIFVMVFCFMTNMLEKPKVSTIKDSPDILSTTNFRQFHNPHQK